MALGEEMRPIERRVRRMVDAGVDLEEIAWRFRRSPGFIRHVLDWSARSRSGPPKAKPDAVRPLERRILAWRAIGASYAEIGARFRRSPDFIRRVEAIALRRRGQSTG